MDYIGIDPGKTGALVLASFRDENLYSIAVLSFSIVFPDKTTTNLNIIGEWLDAYAHYLPKIYMENVHAMPAIGPERKQGIVSTFNFGKTTGMIYGYLSRYFEPIPINLVSPQRWKNSILGKYHKGKQIAIDYCLSKYQPEVLLRTKRSKVPDHNIADAICIMEYGKRQSSTG